MVSWLLVSCGWLHSTEPTGPSPSDEPVEDPADVDPMVEMAEKKAVRMPGNPRLDAIDWGEAFERQRIDAAYVTPDVERAAKASGVPVLLPNDPALLDDLSIYGGEGWYTATMTGDGFQVLVRGTRAARSVPMSDADEARMGDRGSVTVTFTEGIVTASFSLYGAAYNLEIECTRGPDAPECRDEAIARSYVERLGLAGGKS